MRNSLKPYVNQSVLCRGWVEDWEEIEGDQLRVLVKQVTVKKSDRHRRFNEIQKVSNEHHLNIFVPKSDYIPKRLDDVGFCGRVVHYTRSNGTHDFGVQTDPYVCLESKLSKIYEQNCAVIDNCQLSPETLFWCEEIMPARIAHLREQLEGAGDCLATFHGTYDSYTKELDDMEEESRKTALTIRSACANRKLRRQNKITYNFTVAPITYDQVSQGIAAAIKA